ncbi:helicase-related protein [Desulfolucanica intricata]|uniref:helicase-related protein n=1 Tax=Desulfolucanica intricata TaxID=1285191 RepID=UPI000835D8FD|nr:helicase-related protein [Desulfolucanica intricata]
MRYEDNSVYHPIVRTVRNKLPALIFVFSRGKAERLAEEIGKRWDFLNFEEKKKVHDLIIETERQNPNVFERKGRKLLRKLLGQGIGYHHAGLSPALKNLVETLYERKLIYVLPCTETFAAGVNFPACSTIFDSCRKWDGQSFRGLLNREFFQMAGRAGRRGFDEKGYVFVRIDSQYPDQAKFFNEDDVEPISSHLTITPNTALNLLQWKTDAEIEHFLTNNFSVYQSKKEERALNVEISACEKDLKNLQQHFCEDKDTNSCALYRKKLKKELYKYYRRRRRNPDYQSKIDEIKAILNQPPKDCNFELCFSSNSRLGKITSDRKKLIRLRNKIQGQNESYLDKFAYVCDLLEQLGYIEGRVLLPRGIFASKIHIQEILVTELIFSGIISDASPAEIAAIFAGIDYEPTRRDQIISDIVDLSKVSDLQKELLKSNVPLHFCNWSPIPGPLAYAWHEGKSFGFLLELTEMQEGDVFSLLRREIDLLRQIEAALKEDPVMQQKIRGVRLALDRDEIAVSF